MRTKLAGYAVFTAAVAIVTIVAATFFGNFVGAIFSHAANHFGR